MYWVYAHMPTLFRHQYNIDFYLDIPIYKFLDPRLRWSNIQMLLLYINLNLPLNKKSVETQDPLCVFTVLYGLVTHRVELEVSSVKWGFHEPTNPADERHKTAD